MQGLNDLPIRQVNGAMVYIHDVAHVRDGFPPQTNIVRVDGQRAALLSVIKTGNASTLDIVKGILAKSESLKSQLPPQLKITPLADQSIFVRASIDGVVREGIIAACLTAVMILVFLGSWRSTLIVAVSIPLSILTSLLMLSALGETINIMTLGGLALAVGILVDDATVEIENINRNLEQGKAIEQAILDGAAQIAVPALVATISICIVFVPMFFLSGVAKYLFVPLAEAVFFAMLASYFLSRTVVPTMAKYLLQEHDPQEGEQKRQSRNPFTRFQLAFERRFEKIRGGYRRILELCIDHAGLFSSSSSSSPSAPPLCSIPSWARTFSPPSTAASSSSTCAPTPAPASKTPLRSATGSITPSARSFPKANWSPSSTTSACPIPASTSPTPTRPPVGPGDADITVSLAEKHHPTDDYVQHLRQILPQRFPGTEFYTLPVDMVTQILNFGLPAPIDIQIVGPNQQGNLEFAQNLLNQIKFVPGTADLRIQQPFDNPRLQVNVNRTKAQGAGLAQRDIAQSLLIATSGSFQTSPTYCLDPQNGVEYNIAVQAPQYGLDTLQDLRNIALTPGSGAAASGGGASTPPNSASYGAGAPPSTGPVGGQPIQILGNVAGVEPGQEPATVTHYNITPVIDIYGNVVGTDLASVSKGIQKIVDQQQSHLPRGSHIVVRGQVQTMRTSFEGLLAGLVFSILLVYLLIVVNFQSWLDPFIIVCALPAAISGIVWILFLTHTRLSVPALTGAIMCMGVATSNSILVISFAREQLEETVGDASLSALNAGFVRFRPGAHDRARHDHRHDAHVARPRLRRRTECAARTRRYRRPALRHRIHVVLRSNYFQRAARTA